MALNSGERNYQGSVVDADGRMVVAVTARSQVKYASISVNTAADNTIVAAVPGKKIALLGYVLVASGAVTVQWKSGSTARSGAMALAANGGLAVNGDSELPLIETTAGEALVLTPGGAVQVSGHLAYAEV